MGLGVDGCILLVPASLTQPSLEQTMGFGGRVVSPNGSGAVLGVDVPAGSAGMLLAKAQG